MIFFKVFIKVLALFAILALPASGVAGFAYFWSRWVLSHIKNDILSLIIYMVIVLILTAFVVAACDYIGMYFMKGSFKLC